MWRVRAGEEEELSKLVESPQVCGFVVDQHQGQGIPLTFNPWLQLHDSSVLSCAFQSFIST